MHEQRFVVSDVLWQRPGSDLSGKFSDAGATTKNNRLFLQAILWRFAVARSATCLWPLEQPVPALRRWAKSVYATVFSKRLVKAQTLNMLSLMALSSWSNRRRRGQKGPQHQAIGRSRDWADDNDHRVGGCARQFGSVYAATGGSS